MYKEVPIRGMNRSVANKVFDWIQSRWLDVDDQRRENVGQAQSTWKKQGRSVENEGPKAGVT